MDVRGTTITVIEPAMKTGWLKKIVQVNLFGRAFQWVPLCIFKCHTRRQEEAQQEHGNALPVTRGQTAEDVGGVFVVHRTCYNVSLKLALLWRISSAGVLATHLEITEERYGWEALSELCTHFLNVGSLLQYSHLLSSSPIHLLKRTSSSDEHLVSTYKVCAGWVSIAHCMVHRSQPLSKVVLRR